MRERKKERAVLFIDYNILYSIIRGVYGYIDGQYPWCSRRECKIVGKITNVVDYVVKL